jgi:hypothetical protein
VKADYNRPHPSSFSCPAMFAHRSLPLQPLSATVAAHMAMKKKQALPTFTAQEGGG